MREVALVFILAIFSISLPAKSQESDLDIARHVIADSIAAYPGSCACPYSTMRNGARCGQRSAYSRPGGAAPVCYPNDVTPEMIAAWKQRNSAPRTVAKRVPAPAGPGATAPR